MATAPFILYRRFFRGAIVALLTAGATLGAALLFFIALRKSLTALDLFPFILPRFKYVRLWRPEWASAAFVLMRVGLALGTFGAMLPPGA